MSALVSVKLRGDMEIDGVQIAPDSRIGLLIAYLCSVPIQTASRNEICDVLWPEKDRERQQLSLRQTLFQAQKLVKIDSNRHSLRLVGVVHDLAIQEWNSVEIVLKKWTHPWVIAWQDQDINTIVTIGVKILENVSEPFQKVEVLVRIREFCPLDQRFIDALREQFEILGWHSQIASLEEEVEGALSKMTLANEPKNYSRFIADSLGSQQLEHSSLSRLQRLDLALALFPIFLSQGKLKEGFELVSQAKQGTEVPFDTELKVRYALIRLAYNQGDRNLAFAQAHGLDPQSTNGMECYVLGMAALAKNRFEQCIRWAKRGLRDPSNSADLSSALCSLAASTCTYVQKDREGLKFCAKGIEFAHQCDNKYHEVALRAIRIFCTRAIDIEFDLEKDVIELAQFCQEEGFLIRQAHLLGLLGQHYQLKGELRKAQEVLQHSIVVSETIKNDETKAMSLDYLGEVLVKAGKYHEAVLTFQQSTLIRRRLSDKLGAATSYRGAGRGLLLLEEHEFALKMFERAISLYRSLEHEILEGGCLLYKLVALVKMDRMPAAKEVLDQTSRLLRGKDITVIRNAVDRDIHRMIECIHQSEGIDCKRLAELYSTVGQE